MGYTLEIGQPYVEVCTEYNYTNIEVKEQHHDSAPAFGEPTDHTNSRWPSYSSWRDFARLSGLENLFYDDCKGLMAEHPGVFPLTQDHKQIIDAAYLRLKKKYPDSVAGFDPGNEINGVNARLTWLKYWVDWSLENCESPVFKNT